MNLPNHVVNLRSTYVLRGNQTYAIIASELFGIHKHFILIHLEMLSRGFTTVRDAGGASAALAEAIDEWLIPGPRLIQCGKALSQTVRSYSSSIVMI